MINKFLLFFLAIHIYGGCICAVAFSNSDLDDFQPVNGPTEKPIYIANVNFASPSITPAVLTNPNTISTPTTSPLLNTKQFFTKNDRGDPDFQPFINDFLKRALGNDFDFTKFSTPSINTFSSPAIPLTSISGNNDGQSYYTVSTQTWRSNSNEPGPVVHKYEYDSRNEKPFETFYTGRFI